MVAAVAPDPTPHSTPLLGEVKMRLNASALPDEVASLVLGALEGVDESQRAAVRGVYVKSITAQGFRGIGPSQTLAINPGPGLTVITGRNGSGKSSFSEAIEVALTGRNRRWDDEKGNIAQPIQQGGWRNLHEPNQPRIDLELSVSGRPDPVVITRTWAGSAFNESTAVVAGLGDQPLPPSALGWENDLTAFRPVLAYSELGQMTSAKQSQMYDALAKLLGLGSLAEAYDRLGEREKRLKEDGKQADALLPSLRADLANVDDERAARAARALAGKTPDREEIRSLVSGAAPSSSSEQARLYRLAGLVGPDLTAVADAVVRVREAVATADDARYTRTGDALAQAELLDRALQYYRRHSGEHTCPVCAAPDRLDEAWADQVNRQVDRLRAEADEAHKAHRALEDARNDLLALIDSPPPYLPDPLQLLWESWSACREARTPAELASTAESRVTALAEACRHARKEAERQLATQDERWRAVAPRLATWLTHSDAAAEAKPVLREVAKAKTWLRSTQSELRDERVRGIAEKAQMIWQCLCQDSSVSLGAVELTGSDKYTGRGVQLDVTVDDAQAHALAVVSQGEAFALALALFLPRATSSDSPFDFIVVDDPVQSMDPRKVDGLARLLAKVAETRQVIVFSHDTRLPSALRFHRLKATVLEIGRQAHSVVTVTTASDPVERELSAARAISKDLMERGKLEILREVLPAQCRLALETALQEAVWRNLLSAGITYQNARDMIENANELIDLASLALFHAQRERTAVYAEIRQRLGEDTSELIAQCNEAVRSTIPIPDPHALIKKTESAAKGLRSL